VFDVPEKLTVPKKLLIFNLHNLLLLVLKINEQHLHVPGFLNTCRQSLRSEAPYPPSHGYNVNTAALTDMVRDHLYTEFLNTWKKKKGYIALQNSL